jgi:hypothetical protein
MGKNNIYFHKALDSSSSLLAWDVVQKMVSLQDLVTKNSLNFLYSETVLIMLKMFLVDHKQTNQPIGSMGNYLLCQKDRVVPLPKDNAKDHAKKLFTATIVMRSIFRGNKNVTLPLDNILPWKTIETEIFPTLRLMKVKLWYEDFNGSQVVDMIITAHGFEPI